MIYRLDDLKQVINDSVFGLMETPAFQAWLQEQAPQAGDIIVLNNSFVLRGPLVKTTKNKQYLCIKVKKAGDEIDLSQIMVVTPGNMNLDFKLYSGETSDLPPSMSLDDALRMELDHLGHLIFVLIGQLEDCPAEVEVKHSTVKKLKFEPKAQEHCAVEAMADGKLEITVNQLIDADKAWEVVESELQNEINDFQNLKKQFETAFDNLCENARIELQLPTSDSPQELSFLSRVRRSVAEQRQEYKRALDKYLEAKNLEMFSNEIMRIAYNFSSDATKVLQILVSIADLKAVMLWCTIKEHFDVAQAFRNLPVLRDKDKPSLKGYERIISGARNHAFHNLFNFDRTIEAKIDGIQFTARSLTIMPPYSGTGSKKAIRFHYDDREVIEVLSELSRAPEKAVPLEFWKKNAIVMETFEKLLERSEATLWALHTALQGT